MKKSTIGVLLTAFIAVGCYKTISYSPAPENVKGDPFALLEKLVQSEGYLKPVLFEINASYFKAVYVNTGGRVPQSSTVYFEDIDRATLGCKGSMSCTVYVRKKDGEVSFKYITKLQETAQTFIDALFAARDASAEIPQTSPLSDPATEPSPAPLAE